MPSRRARNAKYFQQEREQQQNSDNSDNPNSNILANLPSDLSFDDTPPSPPRTMSLDFDDPPGQSTNMFEPTSHALERVEDAMEIGSGMGIGFGSGAEEGTAAVPSEVEEIQGGAPSPLTSTRTTRKKRPKKTSHSQYHDMHLSATVASVAESSLATPPATDLGTPSPSPGPPDVDSARSSPYSHGSSFPPSSRAPSIPPSSLPPSAVTSPRSTTQLGLPSAHPPAPEMISPQSYPYARTSFDDVTDSQPQRSQPLSRSGSMRNGGRGGGGGGVQQQRERSLSTFEEEFRAAFDSSPSPSPAPARAPAPETKPPRTARHVKQHRSTRAIEPQLQSGSDPVHEPESTFNFAFDQDPTPTLAPSEAAKTIRPSRPPRSPPAVEPSVLLPISAPSISEERNRRTRGSIAQGDEYGYGLMENIENYSRGEYGDGRYGVGVGRREEPVEDQETGHVRAPVLARHHTRLESLTRTVKTYVPSSIPSLPTTLPSLPTNLPSLPSNLPSLPTSMSGLGISIPSAVPSPPRVSRPGAFGSMTSPSSTGTNRRQQHYGQPASQGWNIGMDGTDGEQEVFGLDEDDARAGGDGHEEMRRGVGYPAAHPLRDESIVDGGRVLWSRWDVLPAPAKGHGKSRHLLFVGYTTGLHIWDCTNLERVHEVLNLSESISSQSRTSWGRVRFAAVLPTPAGGTGGEVEDALVEKRPLIGIVAQRSREEPEFIVYSLSSHEVVNRRPIPGLVSFLSNASFIIISTSNPASLRILSSCTLSPLYLIPAPSLSITLSTTSRITNNTNQFTTPSRSTTNANQQYQQHKDTSVLLNQTTTAPSPSSIHNHLDTDPQPVFALSGRLLAFASPPPRPDSPASTSTSRQPRERTSTRTDSTVGSVGGIGAGVRGIGGMSQAELGNAALKVGGTVLSGLWSAGRGAYSAARTKMAGEGGASSPTTPTSVDPRVQAAGGGLAGMWFSKSAPAASQKAYADDGGRVVSLNEDATARAREEGMEPMMSTSSASDKPAGSFVTVVDLQPLLALRGKDDTETKPETLAEFLALKRQAVSGLKFSEDGANIVVVPEDGQVGRVFAVRPRSKALRRLKRGAAQGVAGGGEDEAVKDDGAPWHMYDLRRGRTNAIIDGIDISSDGRWVAMGSRKRTIHVFATNPYGGKADEYSHTGGQVVNCKELPLSTSLSPIVRLRATTPSSSTNEQPPPSLSFAFLNPALDSVPQQLLPPASISTPTSSAPSSISSSPSRVLEPISPTQRLRRPTNYQDILVFDEADSTLSLRRFFVDPKPVEQNLKVPGSVPGFGGTSISLPSRSSLGWMSGVGASPQPTGQAGRTISSGGSAGPSSSALSVMMEKRREIAGREVDVASWNLKRGESWPEVRKVVRDARGEVTPIALNNWLAHAELQTCSRLPLVLPRPIYLYHQFSFHTLGDDYHALIRRNHFDFHGTHIEVRKEVQISAYTAGGNGESFIDDSHAGLHHLGRSSSFDEPLSSAISSDLSHLMASSPPVIPMFPNGGVGTNSFRNSLPVNRMAAGLSEGVSEGLGRLRREIGKVRSPRMSASGGARPDSRGLIGSVGTSYGDDDARAVALEFDEEDEDFMLARDPSSATRDDDESQSAPSISTPSSTGIVGRPATQGHDDEHGDTRRDDDGTWMEWDEEDQRVLEDAEQFQEISVVGFMDEEQEQQSQAKTDVRGRNRKVRGRMA